MNDSAFERQLDKIMGESKSIISPPPATVENKDEIFKQISKSHI